MSEDQTGHSTRFQTIVSSIVFFGTLAIVVLLVIFKKQPKEQSDTRQDPLVEYTAVEPYEGSIKINLSGVTVPFREITIAAEVTGVITAKEDNCRAGEFVSVGKPLLSIDSEKYELAKKRIDAEISEAKARLSKIKADYEAALEIRKRTDEDFQNEALEYKRREELYNNNAISKSELIQSQKNYNAMYNAKTTQDNRVDSLKAEIDAQNSLIDIKNIQKEESVIDFKNATVKAPVDGVIISDDVQKDDFVTVGQKLLVFEDTSNAEIKIDLRPDQLQMILDAQSELSDQVNQFKLPRLDAKITYESNGVTYNWAGKLDRYDGLGLSEATRTAPCRILVVKTRSNNGKRTLVRGMFVNVKLELTDQSGLLKLPAEALRAGNEIWVYERQSADKPDVEDKGKLSIRKIKVVNRLDDPDSGQKIAIVRADSGSLKIGEMLIVSPIPQPIHGMDLRGRLSSAKEKLTDGSQEDNAKSNSSGVGNSQSQKIQSGEDPKLAQIENPFTTGSETKESVR